MKKILIFLCCLVMLMTMPLSVRANDHTAGWNNGWPFYPNGNQHETDEEHKNDFGSVNNGSCDSGGHSVGNATDLGGEKHEGICSGCGQQITESHQYGAWNSNHSRECTVCHAVETGSHSMEESVLKQPSCKEDGTKKNYCTVCTYSETVVLTKLTSHTYDSACDPDCNVCGKQRQTEHSVATTWSKNEEGHWHECGKCDEKIDFAKHNAGPEATEEKDQVCTACSYVIEAKKEHQHTFEKEWTSDKVGHWHRCSGKSCKVENEYASHVYDNDCDADCNTCNYKRENSHSYDTEGWKTSNFEHWNICSVCGEESKHEKHIAGEQATEQTAQVCAVCNFELKAKLEHTHEFGMKYFGDENHHWQECKCGELSVPDSHVWNSGKKNRNDTVTYQCIHCAVEKTEAVAKGFPWLTVIVSVLALICIGGIVVLAVVLKRGNFADDPDETEMAEELEYVDTEEDDEEKMIDDYFASLDEKQY